MNVELIGSIFSGPGKDGDFAWMIEQPEHADSLFVFNDNEGQWRADREGKHGGCSRGGGNAVIRPYQCGTLPQRAIGIPTGAAGQGYRELGSQEVIVIDSAVATIRKMLLTGLYKRVIYSAANESGELGTGIFIVAEDVKRYIVAQLRGVAGGAA